MVAFYKHDTAAWRGGTASLTHEQYRVYHVIVEEMMIQEGSILLHERMLSGLANMSTRAFRTALTALIEAGKLSLIDGRISNGRAERELASIRNNRENAAKGGRVTGERTAKQPRTPRETHASINAKDFEEWEKHNDFNGALEAPLISEESPKREEKRREEGIIPDGISRPNRKRLRTQYGERFESFWGAYPTDSIMSKKDASKEFDKLSDEDQLAAIASIGAFVGYCQTHSDYRPVHACRYLSQRRFESVAAKQRAVSERTFVEVDTDQWRAWDEHGKRTRGRGYPTSQRSINGRAVVGWDFPSAWPPRDEAQHLEAAE